jgi:hypothetical protein
MILRGVVERLCTQREIGGKESDFEIDEGTPKHRAFYWRKV